MKRQRAAPSTPWRRSANVVVLAQGRDGERLCVGELAGGRVEWTGLGAVHDLALLVVEELATTTMTHQRVKENRILLSFE